MPKVIYTSPKRGQHKGLDRKIGVELQMDVHDGARAMVPAKSAEGKRYTLAQLLEGATPRAVKALNDDTAWLREGGEVGRELV